MHIGGCLLAKYFMRCILNFDTVESRGFFFFLRKIYIIYVFAISVNWFGFNILNFLLNIYKIMFFIFSKFKSIIVIFTIINCRLTT